MQPLASYIQEARKFIVTIVGLIGQVIAIGVLSGDALHWANAAVAALTAIAVYLVPNQVSGKKQAEIINKTAGNP